MKKTHRNIYCPQLCYPPELPITDHREEILAAIRENQVLIVAGETGSGKTTQLPKLCLEAGRGERGLIGCTQPRRIAAITVARRVAEELGPDGNLLVGCRIRFHDRTNPENRIRFMTDGLLLAEAHHDRQLATYDTIIVDEAHERSLNIDFLLGILRRLLTRRRDLKVIITSATIDTAKFAAAFGNAPVVNVSGRAYPVEVRYQPPELTEDDEGEPSYVDQAVRETARIAAEEPPGDILVFMPTERDIRETLEGLADAFSGGRGARGGTPVVLPLFGRLSAGDQVRIFQPVSGRKIVVATNVAETSITVPGIRYVVDTGLARIPVYSPRARATRMPVARIARASCDQRKGRAGRVAPGICIRLYSEEDFTGRQEYTLPEIQRANLADVVLRMLALGLGDPARFPFLDPPAGRSIRDGFALLQELGAIEPVKGRGEEFRLTRTGKVMARLPLDPRISRMILAARDANALTEVTVIAAALSVQDPRVRPAEREKEADAAHSRWAAPGSDFLFYWNLWQEYRGVAEIGRGRVRKFCKTHFLSWQRLREWQDVHDQLMSILAEEQGFAANVQPAALDAIHQAILAGSLRNIALHKEKNLFQAAGDREVMIFPGSSLYGKPPRWLMAAEIVETTRYYARGVAAIKPEWLEPLAGTLCRSTYSEPHWEKRRGQVCAWEKVTLFGLLIVPRRRVNYGRINPEEARPLFIEQALVEGEIAGNYRFLEKNRQLIESFEELEKRVRRRGILVDETMLAAFYEERLPAGVVDQAGLNRFIKEEGEDRLVMTDDDVLRDLPPDTRLADFPDTLPCGEAQLKLSYHFAPGAEDDGVTVHIPITLLPSLAPDLFEWLVPGLLPEKVLLLLKGLPKATRKLLIPIAQTTEDILADLRPGAGSLLYALELAIYNRFRVRVARRDWPGSEDLPRHLRMRFSLERDGKSILVTRELRELVNEQPDSSESADAALAGLRKQWERSGISGWDFEGVPDRLPITSQQGLLAGYAYFGVEALPDGQVSLRLTLDPAEAVRVTRQGILALYRPHFREPWKMVARDCVLPKESWAILDGIGTRDQVNRDLQNFVLMTVFNTDNGKIPSKEVFQNTIATVAKTGLLPRCREVLATVIAALQERRTTLDTITRWEKHTGGKSQPPGMYALFRKEAAAILLRDFLQQATMTQLADAVRYLKALAIRVERFAVTPGKDAAKAAQLAPFAEFLRKCEEKEPASTEGKALLEEFRAMVREFRISLFAPEIKTAFPVSAKRLAAKQEELAGYMREA